MGPPAATLYYGSEVGVEIEMGPASWYVGAEEECELRKGALLNSKLCFNVVPHGKRVRVNKVIQVSANEALRYHIVEPKEYTGWATGHFFTCEARQCGRCKNCEALDIIALLPSENEELENVTASAAELMEAVVSSNEVARLRTKLYQQEKEIRHLRSLAVKGDLYSKNTTRLRKMSSRMDSLATKIKEPRRPQRRH